MASLYFYVPDSGLLVSSYWGRTEVTESMEMRAARAADPARASARAHVIDLSDLEGTSASAKSESSMFRALGESYIATYGELPTVIIVSRPSMFGQARVFGTMAGGPTGDFRIEIVSTWREAAEYLGIDLSEAQAELHRRRGAGGAGNAR